MSDPLDDEFEDFGPPPRRRSRLLILLFCFVLLVVAISAFTSLWTDKLWFQSLGRTRVFDTLLATKSGLFFGFGLFMGLMVSVNIVVAYRARPMIRARTVEDDGLERYRDLITPSRRLLVAIVGLVVALFAGGSALGQWRNYLMWANAQPFHKVDPWFHKDIGFYVFSLPWWHFVVNFVLTSVVVALLAALVTHYLYGGIRLQVSGERFGTAAQRHVCVLLGLLVLSKAASYYLGRFDLTTRNGSRFTGMSYARQHASLPAQDALMVIAVICALIFFLNLWRPSWLLPGVGVGLFVLTSILLGVIWPAIVQRFQVKPNEIDKEAPYIAANIKATRQAYGVAGVKVTSFPAKETLSRQAVAASATSLASVWLLDPSVVSSTFQQLQQVRGYYAVPPLLSVDRYPVGGDQRGLVLAARELNLAGLPQDKKKWSNEHTVYTHGYGMIAAYGDQLPAKGAATPARDVPGEPVWAEGDIPPKGVLGDYQPRIYFGQYSPDYSIVGHSPNQPDFEVDYPASSGDSGNSTTTMYDGPGVPIGSTFHKILYALKFGDSSILLSSRVNDDSVLLYDRSPERRVAKVAPWLTLDSNPYPAVVDGRILWIIDGYTTSDRYAGSAKRSMSSMTSDSRSQSGLNTVPGDELNYIRNSVKATVDAYTGEVTLYAWDESDPILKAMEQAFPGQVEPKKDIPRDLLAHLRYPDDLFKAQRSILKDYHVVSPTTFFNDSDAWDLPNNPSVSAQQQPPYRLVVPPAPGAAPVYSLTSAYTPYDRQNLAAYLSVGSDPTQPSTYGKLSILRLPDDSQVSGPDNVANLFNRSSAVTKRLQSYRMSRAKVVYGNLLSMPVDSSGGGGMLYVEPMYALRSKGSGNFPVLAFVMVSDGNRVGVGDTLAGALGDMFGEHKKVSSPGTSEPSGSLTQSEISLLQQASVEFTKADNALRKGNLTEYASHVERARELVQKALADSRANPAAKKATTQ